jgi:predicted dehydrogenase
VSHPVRIALIGFGYWGPNYARVLSELPGADLVLVCDRSVERLGLVANRHRAVPTCSRVDDVFARDDVDAVVIATPASTHASLVRQALEHGRHVPVEKPMALDVAACEALCQLSASANRVLMVGYTFLYNAGVRKMKECMGPEPFGQMYYLHATRTNLGPIRQDVNAVWDLAPHDVAIFNYLLDDQPTWASAIGTRVLRTDRDDIAFATLGYRNDVVGNIHVSWADPNKVREVVAVGSRRRIVFNDLNDVERVRVFERGVSVSEDDRGLVRRVQAARPRRRHRQPEDRAERAAQESVRRLRAGRPRRQHADRELSIWPGRDSNAGCHRRLDAVARRCCRSLKYEV